MREYRFSPIKESLRVLKIHEDSQKTQDISTYFWGFRREFCVGRCAAESIILEGDNLLNEKDKNEKNLACVFKNIRTFFYIPLM